MYPYRIAKSVVFALLCCLTTHAALAVERVPGARNAVHEQGRAQFDCVIEPSEIVDVGSAVAGVIENIAFDRSDLVEKGQAVARLESGLEQASLELASVRSKLTTAIEIREANAGFVGRNQSRSRTLFNESAISGRDMDQLETERRLAELQVRQEKDNQRLAGLELRRAREALDRRRIRSPIDGVVVERYKSVGEYVEDTPVMRIAQLNPLHIETIVPAEMIRDIGVGMQATVTPIIDGEAPYVAKVVRIDRVADAATGTFGVRLSLDNADYSIPSGLRCQLAFDPDSAPAVVAKVAPPKERPATSQGSPKAPEAAAKASPAATVVPVVNVLAESDVGQCYRVGPLSSRSQMERLGSALGEVQSLVVSSRSAQTDGGDMLVLAVGRGTAADVRKLGQKIKSEGVSDTYVLPRGPWKGRLSLGLFKNRTLADRYRAQITSAGYDAEVVPRSPRSASLWADVEVQSGGPSQRTLEQLVVDVVPAAAVEIRSCKSLAARR